MNISKFVHKNRNWLFTAAEIALAKMDFDNTTISMSIPMSSIKSIFIYKE